MKKLNFRDTIYWISTIIMCAIFLFSAFMYLTKYQMVAGFYEHLGFPTWIIYPSALLKLVGVSIIISRKFHVVKEWAYAGFFFDALLATGAHYFAGDGLIGLSTIALIATVLSRFFEWRKER